MKRTTARKPRFTIISLVSIVTFLVMFYFLFPSSSQCPSRIMPTRTTHANDAARRCQEDEAMAAATLQKEKDGGLANEGSHNDVVNSDPRPSVVSPPVVPNLNSLLTGHIGQEVEKPAAKNGTAMEEEHVDDNVKSPQKKKVKKAKIQKMINRRSAIAVVRASNRPHLQHTRLQQHPLRRITNLSKCSTRQGLNSRARTNIVPTLSTSGISLKTFSWSTLWQRRKTIARRSFVQGLVDIAVDITTTLAR
jgi:hypothetical protein